MSNAKNPYNKLKYKLNITGNNINRNMYKKNKPKLLNFLSTNLGFLHNY